MSVKTRLSPRIALIFFILFVVMDSFSQSQDSMCGPFPDVNSPECVGSNNDCIVARDELAIELLSPANLNGGANCVSETLIFPYNDPIFQFENISVTCE